jgi:CRP/FNR family transcriptional regulator
MDVKQRLIRFIEVRYGRHSDITSPLSKKDTAAAISVRPETLSRALRELDAADILVWKRDHITISPTAWELV